MRLVSFLYSIRFEDGHASTYLADDVHSAWTSADKVRGFAVRVFECLEEAVPSCRLRLYCVFGVDVGERGLGWDFHVVGVAEWNLVCLMLGPVVESFM
jgi:hypothetical protein